jgi:ADP-dependent NAD(P)H-hydrate dehydratase
VTRAATPRSARVNSALLRRWPLPPADGDKEDRGRLLVVAAAPDVPGAAILAGTAGLRAGAGKLCIAAAAAAVTAIGTLVPECRAVAYAPRTLAALLRERFDALLIGPGMTHSTALSAFVRRALAAQDGTVVLDAGAQLALRQGGGRATRLRTRAQHGEATRCVITPHAGEMAKLLGIDKDDVQAQAAAVAVHAAAALDAIVVLKGSITFIADPQGRVWQHDGGSIALATSGSGDTLGGIIAGLAARGAPPAQAAVHGVYLHAQAGSRAARRTGPLGALAREFAAEIPALMTATR